MKDRGSESFAIVWVAMALAAAALPTIAIASLRSLVSIMQKEERENNRQRGTNREKEKKLQLGALGNKKEGF